MGIAEEIDLFEQNLNDLIIRYEQYFLGLEKRAPNLLLDDVERASRKYQGYQIVNTMQKFRYNSTIARLNSYKQYWNRINRLIEDGKYSRDRFKMEMHQKEEPAAPSKKEPGRMNPELQSVYQQFIEARKACNLPVATITPEKIASAIEKQKPAIVKKYNCSNVELIVVVEKGMPKIKVRPRH
ncbi:MAG TPA: MXAN_5187 C-terminal domain-containing protein [Geobacteraceae bacterium]|nr:MXAN_5187 C-terminal domain-containing protein [Geobacteraceae bacterium]